jgi:hypothetical protein
VERRCRECGSGGAFLGRTLHRAQLIRARTSISNRSARQAGIVGAVLIATGCMARTDPVSALERFDFATRVVDSATIDRLSLPQLRLVRGIVFGRHGRSFRDSVERDIAAYLAARAWYRPDTLYSNTRLNATEKANLDVIRGAEARRHEFIQPGDLRFMRDRTITRAMLGHHSTVEWRQLVTEIGAVHGQHWNDYPSIDDDFGPSDPGESLQLYYDERYWYQRRKDFKVTDITPAERAIIDTLEIAQMLDQGSIYPGVMHRFRTVRLTVDQLPRNLYHLRILRNEIYALHGRRFTTPWLRRHFEPRPAYTPRDDFRAADLSAIERDNVLLIRQLEDEMHENLSSRPITEGELEGLFASTARLLRNEIYARRGRRFRDPVLQSYFSSLPWYRPDPTFTEASLSGVERQNVRTILDYENSAREGMRFAPA